MNKLLDEAKALNIQRPNLMKKDELEQAIKDIILRYKELIYGSDVICKSCLDEIYKEGKIDEKIHLEKLLVQGIRDLCFQYCLHTKTIIDEKMLLCHGCGLVLQESEANQDRDYLSHKTKKR